MKKIRSFTKTACRIAGTYLAWRWLRQVLRFSGPASYTSWFHSYARSGAARQDFVAGAVNVIRKLFPLDRKNQAQILDWISITFGRFTDLIETYAPTTRQCIVRSESLLEKIHDGLNEYNTSVIPQRPWSLLKELAAVAGALRNQVIPWDVIEHIFGFEAGMLAAKAKEQTKAAEEPVDRRAHAGADGGTSHPARAERPTGSLRERLLDAIRTGEIETGTAVYFFSSPVAVLIRIPVLRGGLVDAFSLVLAEVGARLGEASKESEGKRMAARAAGSAPKPIKRKIIHSSLVSDIEQEFSRFRRPSDGENRGDLIYLEDYLAYPGRKTPADLPVCKGVIWDSLEQWMWSELLRPGDDSRNSSVTEQDMNMINFGLGERATLWAQNLAALKEQ